MVDGVGVLWRGTWTKRAGQLAPSSEETTPHDSVVPVRSAEMHRPRMNLLSAYSMPQLLNIPAQGLEHGINKYFMRNADEYMK